MKLQFIKGYRNHYKFPIGIYVCKNNNHFKTINFRYKHKVWCLIILFTNIKYD